MADSFDLLAEYADQIHSTTLGAPHEAAPFQAVKKATKKKGSVPISVKPVSDSFISKKDNIIINTETAEIIEASLRDLYALLNTKDDTIIKLLRHNNKTLDRVINTITDWYGYEKEKDLLNKLEKHGNSEAEEALNEAKAESAEAIRRKEERQRQREEEANQNQGGGIDIDTGSKEKNRKKRSRTRPAPNSEPRPKKGFWNKVKGLGETIIKKGGGTGKKLAALLATGAVAAGVGFPTFGGGEPELAPEVGPSSSPEVPRNTTAPEVPRTTTTPEVTRTTAPTSGPSTAQRSIANAFGEGNEITKPSIWKKGAGYISSLTEKIHVPKLMTALSVASAGLDAYKVEQDPTLTRDEKNEAHAGQAGQVVGTLGAGVAGSVVGGLIGGAIGTLAIPGVGTVGGAAVGAEIGSLLASSAASILASDAFDKAGKAVYDFFVKDIHEDKPQRIQLAMNDVKIKAETDGKDSSILPQSITPYTERNYGNPTMSPSYSGSTGYSGIPQSYRNVVNGTASAGDIGGYENVPALGVLKDLKNSDKREARLSNWNGLFEKYGAMHGVDPRLVRAVMKQESGGINRAVSPTGVKGLMQLTQATASGLGVTDREDPNQSVNGGAKYLAQLLKKHKGNVPLALASYNAGPGAVDLAIKKAGTTDPAAVLKAMEQVTWTDKKGNVHRPDAKQAQDYVRNITGFYADYKKQTDKNPDTKQIASPDKKAESTVADAQPTNLVEKQPEVKPSNVVAKPIIETSRNDLTATIPAYTQPVTPTPPAATAPMPPTAQNRTKSMSPQQSGNRTTIPTLDDMPMMIDEFGLTHLNLGGA